MRLILSATLLALAAPLAAASQSTQELGNPSVVAIDRFSDQAGHLFVRSAAPGLPAANAPINFDDGPFITRGLGPDGAFVSYYNFDAQPRTPAKIYVLVRHGAETPVADQLNLVDAIPGGEGYSDFWNVVKVEVPASYAANDARSVDDLIAAGYPMQATAAIVNCPIVPAGSSASLRYADQTDIGLHQGWYRGALIHYFNFSEKSLTATSRGLVPISPIYVAFNKNPDASDPTSGPASGFRIDPRTGRAHNVIATTPEDASYSPLWNVNVYDNEAFASVEDLSSAKAAKLLAGGVAQVNCPVVEKAARD